jgi:DNA-binding transcriptional LysR family regulator
MLRQLREGSLDGGIAATPLGLPGIAEHALCHEAFYAYLPRGHALTALPHVRQADLLDQHLWLLGEGHCFRAQVLALCSADRTSGSDWGYQVQFDVGSFETLVGVVDEGFGVTACPSCSCAACRRLSANCRCGRSSRPSPCARSVSCTRANICAAPSAPSCFLREGIPSSLRGRAADSITVLQPIEPTTSAKRMS